MDLDDVAVRLRSRPPYESIDLGFAVARHFWRPVYAAWLACVLPVVVGATLLGLWTGMLWLPLLIVWLLKPAYDRIPLFVVSRSLFGEVPDVGRTVRSVLSNSFGHMLLDCTLLRLAPFRAVVMPLAELEGLSGSRYRSRKSSLLRSGVKLPYLLFLLVCMVFEGLVLAAGYVSIYLFAPPEFRGAELVDPSVLMTASSVPSWAICLGMASYFVAISLGEVFYVAGSFGLYINRRIELEGWDVEIDFKRLARRIGGSVSHWVPLLAGALLATVTVLTPGSTAAEPGPKPLDPDDDPKATAEKVLEDDIFGETREETRWVRIKRERESFDMSSGVGDLIGMVVEIALWVVLGAAVLVAIFFLIRQLDWGGGAQDGSDAVVDAISDPEDYDPEETEVELPRDIVDAAQRYWNEGEPEAAFSLLYRATLRHLADHYELEIRPDTTARRCAHMVRRAGGPGDFVARLGRAWTSTAYAGRPPDDHDARELFRAWRRHFRRGDR